MKLTIHNFSKLKDININIDGITVIAGNNNTGKSTIGKIVFSVFNSLCQNESKIEDEVYSEFTRMFHMILREYMGSGIKYRAGIRKFTRKTRVYLFKDSC